VLIHVGIGRGGACLAQNDFMRASQLAVGVLGICSNACGWPLWGAIKNRHLVHVLGAGEGEREREEGLK